MNVLRELEKTINPRKGGGMKETIMFVSLIVAIVVLEIFTQEVNPMMYALLGSMGGYLVGGNHSKKKEAVAENE